MTRPLRPFVVRGFATTHDALAAEKRLKGAGIEVVPIPTPRALGAKCGIALRIAPDAEARADDVLLEAGVEPHSRATMEEWDRSPPDSATTAPARASMGVQPTSE